MKLKIDFNEAITNILEHKIEKNIKDFIVP